MTMTKLSDLIPEQLEQCIGMWVETAGNLFILQSIEQREAALISPTGIHPMYEALGQITPRFDLPRAWAPDGSPVKGEDVENFTLGEVGDDLLRILEGES